MARARAFAGECGGLTEGDRISQAGIAASGEFSYPLNRTGLHTTRTETGAALGRAESRASGPGNNETTLLPRLFPTLIFLTHWVGWEFTSCTTRRHTPFCFTRTSVSI